MNVKKRDDYISWNDYFMGVAILAAHRSKDPHSQVGCCVVSRDKKILGVGYNGFPIGCSDEELPWGREGAFLETKYPYVCHAELNAVMNSNFADLRGAIVYVTLFPCNECTKLLIQKGVGRIVYLSDKYHDSDSSVASRRMLDMAGVEYEAFQADRDRLTIDFAQEARDARQV
ncbi:dCMP deaminase family protein [Candidatus Sumerlaeota bacterium]|nr:dCMP deaminase family protein [Candidatus Sumerlaeota bacterium]